VTGRCMAAGCPHPEFTGREQDPNGHMRMPDGTTYCFSCFWRWHREVTAGGPPVTRSKENE
jgi:hypothetical protein